MITITPYLMFNGNCEEAMNFYMELLGGKIVNLSRYKEMAADLPEDYREKIMHMSVDLGNGYLMGADYAPGVVFSVEPGKSGVHLSVNFDTTEQMENCYSRLGEEGNITMDIQDTFWGERFAMVTDKYGYNWMLSAKIAEKK